MPIKIGPIFSSRKQKALDIITNSEVKKMPTNKISILIVYIVCSIAIISCSAPNTRTDDIDDTALGLFPVYGNWCGPLHPDDSILYEPEPIDEVDAYCMQHDKCYTENGYASCDCDLDLMEKFYLTEEYSSEQASNAASAINTAFTVYPCRGPETFLKLAAPFVRDNGKLWQIDEDGELDVSLFAIPFMILYALFDEDEPIESEPDYANAKQCLLTIISSKGEPKKQDCKYYADNYSNNIMLILENTSYFPGHMDGNEMTIVNREKSFGFRMNGVLQQNGDIKGKMKVLLEGKVLNTTFDITFLVKHADG